MAEQLKLDLEGRRPRRAGPDAKGDPAAMGAASAQARARWVARRLSVRLAAPVRLIITDNRRTMISARRERGTFVVRLHHMFLSADDATVDALGAYLEGGNRHASMTLDHFIARNNVALRGSRRRGAVLRGRGAHHDLDRILVGLADRYFNGAVEARITWGRRVRRGGARRSIQLGTYLADEQLIRIHPVLDQDWVPSFYVETVVFHELLHHDIPCVVKNGRRWFHTKEFRDRERAFEHFDLAEQWERKHLERLLRGG